jgi:hypothetical protein
MKWRVLVELAGEAGGIELREVSLGECATAACSPETLGLSIAERPANADRITPPSGPGGD